MAERFRTSIAWVAALCAGGLNAGWAAAEGSHRYDMPAQTLAQALDHLIETSDLVVQAQADTLSGKMSRAVVGEMTPVEAAEQLVAGSGLVVHRIDSSSVAILPPGDTVSQNANDEPLELGTIVLRGELQERTLQESPTSAVVETGETLERRGDLGLFSVVDRAPSVVSVGGNLDVSIRGVQANGFGGGEGRLITLQVDGVAFPDRRSLQNGPFSVWDLEQVEILRGPQSTQQGRNALAGAVILRSADPSFEHELRVRAEFASRNFQRFALVYNQPLIADRLALRISAETFSSDSLLFNTALNAPEVGDGLGTVRAKLLWAPTERFEAVLSFTRTRGEGARTSFLGVSPDAPAIVQLADPNFEINRNSIWGLRLNYDITDALRLESETDFLFNERDRQFTADGQPANTANTAGSSRREVFEQDLRLRFDTAAVQGVVGLFYTSIDSLRLGFGNAFLPPNIRIPLNTRFEQQTENYAVYGEVDLRADRWLPGLFFTLGARYDVEDFRSTITTPLVGAQTSDTSFSAFLPKLGATYEFKDRHRVSFTVQRAYRAGGVEIVRDGTVNDFDAEFATNYELAYRGSFYDDLLRVSANAYFTDWRDQQVTVDTGRLTTTGLPILNTENAGRSELRGVELSVEGQPSAALSVFASLGYAETEFIDFPRPDPTRPNLAGDRFSNAPELTLSFGYAYAFGNGLTLAMDGNYQDAAFTSVPNTQINRAQSRWLFNAQLTYERGGLLWGAYVRNVFDNRYAQSRFVSNNRNFPIPNLPSLGPNEQLGHLIGEPRTIGFYVERAF